MDLGFGTSLDLAYEDPNFHSLTSDRLNFDPPQQIQQSPEKHSNIKSTPVLLYDPTDVKPSIVQQKPDLIVPVRMPQPVQAQVSKVIEPLVTPSYIDKMIGKKKDLVKIVSLALIIVLAISIFSFIDFSIKDLSASSRISFKQELGIRGLLPIAILFILWNMKLLK